MELLENRTLLTATGSLAASLLDSQAVVAPIELLHTATDPSADAGKIQILSGVLAKTGAANEAPSGSAAPGGGDVSAPTDQLGGMLGDTNGAPPADPGSGQDTQGSESSGTGGSDTGSADSSGGDQSGQPGSPGGDGMPEGSDVSAAGDLGAGGITAVPADPPGQPTPVKDPGTITPPGNGDGGGAGDPAPPVKTSDGDHPAPPAPVSPAPTGAPASAKTSDPQGPEKPGANTAPADNAPPAGDQTKPNDGSSAIGWQALAQVQAARSPLTAVAFSAAQASRLESAPLYRPAALGLVPETFDAGLKGGSVGAAASPDAVEWGAVPPPEEKVEVVEAIPEVAPSPPEATPESADLLARAGSFDLPTLEEGVRQFFDKISHLGRQFAAAQEETGLPTWVAAAVAAAIGLEVTRRQFRRSAIQPDLAAECEELSWTYTLGVGDPLGAN